MKIDIFETVVAAVYINQAILPAEKYGKRSMPATDVREYLCLPEAFPKKLGWKV